MQKGDKIRCIEPGTFRSLKRDGVYTVRDTIEIGDRLPPSEVLPNGGIARVEGVTVEELEGSHILRRRFEVIND